METFFTHGKHQIVFTNLNDRIRADIMKSGVRIYMFCEGYADTFISVLNTMKLFVGGLSNHSDWPKIIGSHVPEYMV